MPKTEDGGTHSVNVVGTVITQQQVTADNTEKDLRAQWRREREASRKPAPASTPPSASPLLALLKKPLGLQHRIFCHKASMQTNTWLCQACKLFYCIL